VLELKNKNIIPSHKRLRDMLDIKLQRVHDRVVWDPVCSLPDFVEQHIMHVMHLKSTGTINQYRNTLRILTAFAKETGKKLEFEDIDLKFHADFRKYMRAQGYSDSYLSNQIKFIRLFMNEATELGYNRQLIFKSRKFGFTTPETAKIYLTEAEINSIQQLHIEGSIILSATRDLFIVGCRTGLRFSDLVRLNPSNFNESEKILRITTQKTNKLVYIPLTADVMEICRKYNYSLPYVSNGVFNIHIKEIACMAGVEEDVEITSYKGHEKKREIFKKYKLVSAHTARRSFATNAYLGEVPTIAIMSITGHQTEKSFMKYIRIGSENNARQLLSHPYFLKDCKKK
jgi:integrase